MKNPWINRALAAEKKISLLFCALCAGVLALHADVVTIGGITYDLHSYSDGYFASVDVLQEEPYYNKGDIVIPATVEYDGVTYTVYEIYPYAFINNDSLTSVTLPNTMRWIGSEAFHGCVQLASINFPEGLEEIGADAFWDCSALTSVTLPSTLKSLEWYAFEYCTSLTSVNLPNSIENMGGCIFMGDTALSTPVYNDTYFVFLPYNYAENYTIPDGIQTISYAACENNKSLKSVTIPSSVKKIDGDAFYYCESLTSVTFSEGLEYIEVDAFNNTSITTMALPASLKALSSSMFPSSIETITVAEGNEYYYVLNGCLLEKNTNALVFAPKGTTLPESITKIGDYAFYNRQDITEFVVPSTVTEIGRGAFENCQNMVSISLPEGLTTVGPNMFRYCYELKSITLPSTLNDFSNADDMFTCCYKLETVNMLGNPTFLPSQFFYECRSLKSFDLPESVTDCDYSTFAYTFNLTSPVYNSHFFARLPVTHKGEYTIPEGITVIGPYAFYMCDSLSNVTFPSTLRVVGDEAFWSSNQMTRIELPAGVDSIMEYAFDGCQNVETLILPSTITYIGSYAFSFFDESKLKEIYNYAITPFEDPNWDDPFQGILNLDEIKLYVPAASVDAYKAAPYWQDFDVQPMPETPTGLQNQNSGVKSQKRLVNGQLLIEKNGKTYNALGVEIK